MWNQGMAVKAPFPRPGPREYRAHLRTRRTMRWRCNVCRDRDGAELISTGTFLLLLLTSTYRNHQHPSELRTEHLLWDLSNNGWLRTEAWGLFFLLVILLNYFTHKDRHTTPVTNTRVYGTDWLLNLQKSNTHMFFRPKLFPVPEASCIPSPASHSSQKPEAEPREHASCGHHCCGTTWRGQGLRRSWSHLSTALPATGVWQTNFMRKGQFSFLFHKKMGFFTDNYAQTIMLLTAFKVKVLCYGAESAQLLGLQITYRMVHWTNASFLA